ncbi:MAG: hypothetical protein L6420_00215 [Elusimicrobia bacterium]|nr:hypothetical protein [Elusimicrobiota bacterium]
MDSYSVILKNSDEERLKIQNFLKDYYSFDEEKTLAFLKQSPGFLSENKTIEKAEEIYKKAKEKNLQTLIINDKDIPQPPKPLSLEKMEIKTSGFFYIAKSIKEYLSFEKINMIATGIISEECPETSTNNLSFTLQEIIEKLLNIKKTEDSASVAKVNTRKELIFYMDIFLSESPYRLRIKHDNLDYSFLEKEKSYSSLENFKILLNKFAALSLKAIKNKTTNAILNKEPLSSFIYDSIDSYEKEIIWLNIVASVVRRK